MSQKPLVNKGELRNLEERIRYTMRKKLCNFFCLMLVVGIVVLGGTLQSFAEEAASVSSKVAEVTITRL